MKDFTEFSTYLKAAKDCYKSLKDDEFAEKCGISRQSVDDIIKGKTKNPGVSLLYNLQKKLNINPAYFFINTEPLLYSDRIEPGSSNKELEGMIIKLQGDVERYQDELLTLYREKAELERELKRKSG